MNISFNDVTDAALGLPDDERAILAQRLLESLTSVETNEIDDAWREEIEARRESLRRGDAIPVDGYEALRDLVRRYPYEV